MSARRSLLTATAAGALLGALWFVPSANATATFRSPTAPDSQQVVHTEQHRATPSSVRTAAAPAPAPAPAEARARLADTGDGVDTTPYLIGGTAFLGLGAGFVAYSIRRERQDPAY
ncbi:hypothetical protein ACFQ7F_41520 [Streptomyces sp. NPDC056486]|uniref:hypothetical protein n=1 Tax=Streptomyces sp. NPDC056486 TaxID=3345835 RepID=UPI00369913C2